MMKTKEHTNHGVMKKSAIWATGAASSGMLFILMTHLSYALTETVRMKRCFASEELPRVNSFSGIISSIVNAVGSIAMPILISLFQDIPHGWTIIALIFAVPCCVLTLIRFLFLPEVYTDIEEDKKNAGNIEFLESIKLLFQNKYAVILTMILFVTVVATNTGVQDYYFQYVMGDVGLSSVAGIFSILAIFTMAILPKLIDHFGVQKTVAYALVLSVVGLLARYFFPTSIIWCGVMTMVSLVGSLPYIFMRTPMLIDCMDYGKLRTGKDSEGAYAAVSSVINKIGLGLGPVALGFCLELGGYIGGAATQSASAISMIKFLYNGLPALGYAVAIILLHFFDVEKQLMVMRNQEASK